MERRSDDAALEMMQKAIVDLDRNGAKRQLFTRRTQAIRSAGRRP
jgi:hypothetical protein